MQVPPPPRSACIGCPYHTDAEAWSDAIAADMIIRGGSAGTPGPLYLHRSGAPLDEADLDTPAAKGQQPDLFLNECDGMCGV